MNSTWRTHRFTFSGAEHEQGDALKHLDKEWLLANGSGAYAMGTVPGVNTRRYHALLVACLKPPVGRIVALNHVIEQVVLPGPTGESPSTYDLSTCLFRGGDGSWVFHPQGSCRMTDFERGLSVEWTYQLPMLEVTRELHLHWKEQAATLRYSFRSLSYNKVSRMRPYLRLSPLVTLRDFHGITHQGDPIAVQSNGSDCVTLTRDEASVTLQCLGETLSTQPARFVPNEDWWHGFFYPAEERRGQEDHEDCFSPGTFEIPVQLADDSGRGSVTLTAALGTTPAKATDSNDTQRAKHVEKLNDAMTQSIAGSEYEPAVVRALTIAGDDFVVDRPMTGRKLSTILAGYPWFYDWGRDTFISLPGLMLVPKRFEQAKEVLRVFADSIRDGLVPNRFDDYNDTAAHYNTVDGSLWFVNAAVEYLRTSDDKKSWNDWLGGACATIIEAYRTGTGSRTDGMHGKPMIYCDVDGLIVAGSPKTQLTWMDAACNGTIFTPRYGKAVEINALWYHVLVSLSKALVSLHPETAREYAELAAKVKSNYAKVFWDDDQRCLFDTVFVDDYGKEHKDRSLRPNQIFAVSLEHSPLTPAQKRDVLKRVREKLLTPFGLRTLALEDWNYHPFYSGPAFERDKAYHQGTIWPWLIGPLAEATLRVGGFKDASRNQAREDIKGLIDFMLGPGQGQLHEIHEASWPHRPVGCIAQAWSIAEVTRIAALLSVK